MDGGLSFDRFEFDPHRRHLRKAGRPLRVAAQPLIILARLIERPGDTISRETLRAALWPAGTHVDFDASLNTAVRKLRRALGDEAQQPRYIQTVPGIGYRFIGEVQAPRSVVRESAAAPVMMPPQVIDTPARWPAAIALTAALLFFVALPSSQPTVSPALPLLRQGVHVLTQANVAAAREVFAAAVARDPHAAVGWAGLALADARLAFAGDDRGAAGYALARAAAFRALALEPRSWMAHAALGYVSAGQDDDREAAVAAFATAVAGGAGDPTVFIDYACLLKDAGRPDRSLAVIEAGLARVPAAAALHAYRGLYLHAVGRYDEELPALRDAVALDPKSAEVHFQIGLGYARRQQFAASLASLQIAVALSDGAPRYLSWLGRIAADAGQPQQAEDVLRTLRRRAASAPIPAALIESVAYHLAVSRG